MYSTSRQSQQGVAKMACLMLGSPMAVGSDDSSMEEDLFTNESRIVYEMLEGGHCAT